MSRPSRRAPWGALALVALLLAPGAGGHFYLRHADHPAPRTGPGDGFAFFNASASWVVVAPTLEWFRGEGPAFEVPPGLPGEGTWAVTAEPRGCGPPGTGGGIRFRLAGREHAATTPQCGPVTWAFNWQPQALASDGTIALYGPSTARLDGRELGEPTVYQGLTPYYNVDSEDDASADYEVLAGNSFLMSDRSTPDTDDDGDGVPNRGDPDAWPTPWLNQWAARRGLPPWVPSAPRAELLAEDALRAVARQRPDLGRWLGERVDLGPAAVAAGVPAVLQLRVHNDNGSEAIRALRLAGVPGVVHRTFRDVLVDLPAGFAVDAAATRALLPPGWRAVAWEGPGGPRVLYQTTTFEAVFPLRHVDLPLAARAPAGPGPAVVEVTVLYGPAAPERRYAFPALAVVPDAAAEPRP